MADSVTRELTVGIFKLHFLNRNWSTNWTRCQNSGQIDVISMKLFGSNRRRFSRATQATSILYVFKTLRFHSTENVAKVSRRHYRFHVVFAKPKNASKTLQPDTAHVPCSIIFLCWLRPMSCDRFLIDTTQAFLKSPVQTNTFSVRENSALGTVFKNLRFQWKRSHLCSVLVCGTEGENASKEMRFPMKTC